MCPLSMVENGREVEVLDIRGGFGLCQRLSRMGIYPGTRIRILNNGRPGPVIIAVGEKRFGLGFGMAHRIFVRPL
jgi:ferrous iron transport protein A